MDAEDFPTPDVPVDTVAPAALRDRIDDGEDVFLLDTRMSAEYEEWHIEGETVESVNLPYFEFLDDEIDDDVLEQVPGDRTVTVVCAKGGASEYLRGRRGHRLRGLGDAAPVPAPLLRLSRLPAVRRR